LLQYPDYIPRQEVKLPNLICTKRSIDWRLRHSIPIRFLRIFVVYLISGGLPSRVAIAESRKLSLLVYVTLMDNSLEDSQETLVHPCLESLNIIQDVHSSHDGQPTVAL
jgi:hypothetical protein